MEKQISILHCWWGHNMENFSVFQWVPFRKGRYADIDVYVMLVRTNCWTNARVADDRFMEIHKVIVDIDNWIMDLHHPILNPHYSYQIMELNNSLMAFHNSIKLLHNTTMVLHNFIYGSQL